MFPYSPPRDSPQGYERCNMSEGKGRRNRPPAGALGNVWTDPTDRLTRVFFVVSDGIKPSAPSLFLPLFGEGISLALLGRKGGIPPPAAAVSLIRRCDVNGRSFVRSRFGPSSKKGRERRWVYPLPSFSSPF